MLARRPAIDVPRPAASPTSSCGELLAAGERRAVRDGRRAVPRGRAGRLLWILLDGQIELFAAASTRQSCSPTMSTPGQWAGGLAAWGDASSSAGYRATGIAITDGRTFNVPSEDLGRLVGEWFPFGKHMSAASTRRSAASRRRPANASRWSHSARSPPGWPTRSTTRRRRRCAPSRRLRDDVRHDAVVARRPRRATVTAEQFVALDGLRRELAERAVADDGAVATMDREDADRQLAGRRTASTTRGSSPRCSPRPAPTRPGSSECDDGARTRAARSGAAMGLVDASARPALLVELTDTTNRISNLVGAVKSYSQMDRASLQRDRHPRGHREHAGDAGRQARRERRGRARLRRRRAVSRGLRRPSSTRCGRTSSTTPSTRWTATARCGSSTRARRRPHHRRHRRQRPRDARRRAGRVRSNRSSRRRTSARAPGSASTSPAHRRRTPRRRDHVRLGARRDDRPRPPARRTSLTPGPDGYATIGPEGCSDVDHPRTREPIRESRGVPMRVADLRAESHRNDVIGIGETAPRLSWITETDTPSWRSAGLRGRDRRRSTGRVDSDESVFVPWPGPALTARSRSRVRVRVWGTDGSESAWSDPLTVEVGLVDPTDWQASWITPAVEDPRDTSSPAPMFRRSFDVADRRIERARLYVTSAGVHQIHLNGGVVGDHVLAPGWSSYEQPAALRHPRRHVAADRRRERARRRGRRRLVARVSQVGHAPQRLRRPAGPVRPARDHLRRRHDRRDRHRRAVAHHDRPVPVGRPLPRRDVRRSARARRMGSPGLRRPSRGSRRRCSSPRWAGSSHHRARRCVGSRMLRSARCSPPRPGRRCSTSARTSSAGCASR